MTRWRKAALLALSAGLALSTVACSAEGRISDEGIEANVEGEDGNGGGGGGGDGG